MAELTISAQDIQGAIQNYVSSLEIGTGREEVGTVIDAGDGIAHVEGLPSVMAQELLEFPGGVMGIYESISRRVRSGPSGGDGAPAVETGSAAPGGVAGD